MKRILLLFIAIICFGVFAAAADSKVSSKTVSYESGDETVSGILYTPATRGGTKLPAIVVIQEWWGLNDWVKQQAQDLAFQGYETLAVDLYRGKVATTRDEAHELMSGLPRERAMRDLQGAVAYLKSQPNVDANKIGSIGWCMGGGYSAQLAVAEPTLAAAVVNYGPLPESDSDVKAIHAKMLGNFGGKDQGIPPEAVHKFEAQMKANGNPVDFKIYPDAGHGFQNPINGKGYNPEATADAKKRISDFFAATLKK
ncbi:MAG: dienelactone hydrolase family protein [Terriglobales bacterium]